MWKGKLDDNIRNNPYDEGEPDENSFDRHEEDEDDDKNELDETEDEVIRARQSFTTRLLRL